MNRVDKVMLKIRELSCKTKAEDILTNKVAGFSAQYIAEQIGAVRNNITTDLNNLYREGAVIKVTGKPTLFFDRDALENMFSVKLKGKPLCCSMITELVNSNLTVSSKRKGADAFEKLIGAEGSLSKVVKQAKAAMLYPPYGLHTLIFGETGVGKSMFAEIMYEYGKEQGILRETAPFIIFNCADYANNPQFLISQLFGYIKGAYTGADKDKAGLVEIADGGVLFLDEIHRLPPEGQEMLFTFIDKSRFRRLGETSNNRSSQVLIVAATTENPESSLLRTFIRRIPVNIEIPSLKDRKLSERLNIIQNFYSIEAKRLKQVISVEQDVIKALLTYGAYGNIGQLKSDIQLSLARAFLQFKLKKSNKISVSFDCLPEYVKNGMLIINEEIRFNMEKILINKTYDFDPDEFDGETIEEPKDDFQEYFYKIIKSDINNEIDIQLAFNNFIQMLSKNLYSSNIYPDFIDEEILDIVNSISNIIYMDLGIVLERSVYYGLALHLKNLKQENLRNQDYMDVSKVEYVKTKYADIYKTSVNIIEKLENEFDIYCPSFEPYFLTIILSSLKDEKQKQHVGIIIISHGNETATNLADVANELLGMSHVRAINMPLTEKPDSILKKTEQLVQDIDEGKGVILLVDMGSLVTFGERIKESTGIEVKVIDNISTLLVIEAARKALLPHTNIDDIVHSLVNLSQTLSDRLKRRISEDYSKYKKKVIYTVCYSGQGTAFYLEKALNNFLKENNIYDVLVTPLSLENKKQLRDIIKEASKEKLVVAITGSINPMYEDIPFISVEEIILNNGLEKLLDLISPEKSRDMYEDSLNKVNREIALSATTEVVEKYLQFLSANKILFYIKDCMNQLEAKTKCTLSEGLIARFFIHTACMLERIIVSGHQLSAGINLNEYSKENEVLWNFIKESMINIEKAFNITIPDDELYFICELLEDVY